MLGCPGREERWLHTGRRRTSWEGENVGAVYLYRRDTTESAFNFFQVMVSTPRRWLDPASESGACGV